jgi:hypothetical protein
VFNDFKTIYEEGYGIDRFGIDFDIRGGIVYILPGCEYYGTDNSTVRTRIGKIDWKDRQRFYDAERYKLEFDRIQFYIKERKLFYIRVLVTSPEKLSIVEHNRYLYKLKLDIPEDNLTDRWFEHEHYRWKPGKIAGLLGDYGANDEIEYTAEYLVG